MRFYAALLLLKKTPSLSYISRIQLLPVSQSHNMPPNQRSISKRDWDEYQDRIQHWYINKGMTQKEVIEKLEELGFNVTYVFLFEFCLFI